MLQPPQEELRRFLVVELPDGADEADEAAVTRRHVHVGHVEILENMAPVALRVAMVIRSLADAEGAAPTSSAFWEPAYNSLCPDPYAGPGLVVEVAKGTPPASVVEWLGDGNIIKGPVVSLDAAEHRAFWVVMTWRRPIRELLKRIAANGFVRDVGARQTGHD